MENTVPTTRGRTTAGDGNQQTHDRLLGSTKPLHRFVQMDPRSLGIVILLFGCAEILMGFQLHMAGERTRTSLDMYAPFWQGVLFVVSGNLSIYTGLHPSKKMVTVSLSMYVVSLLGIFVSGGYRISCLTYFSYMRYRARYRTDPSWSHLRVDLLYGIEGMLFTSSLCVFVLLIILIVVARLALKSTRTQDHMMELVDVGDHVHLHPQSEEPHRCSVGFRSADMRVHSTTFTLSFFTRTVVVLEVIIHQSLPPGTHSASN